MKLDDDIQQVYEFLIENKVSKKTTFAILNLFNYSHTKILRTSERQKWIKLGILSEHHGKILVGKNDDDIFNAVGILMISMLWEGKLNREFNNETGTFVYDSTRKGDKMVKDVDIERYEVKIMKEILFGNNVSDISKELGITEKRVIEEINILKKKGLIHEK